MRSGSSMFRKNDIDNRVRRGKSANMIPRSRTFKRPDDDARSVLSGSQREFKVVPRSNTRKEEDERSEISLNTMNQGQKLMMYKDL